MAEQRPERKGIRHFLRELLPHAVWEAIREVLRWVIENWRLILLPLLGMGYSAITSRFAMFRTNPWLVVNCGIFAICFLILCLLIIRSLRRPKGSEDMAALAETVGLQMGLSATPHPTNPPSSPHSVHSEGYGNDRHLPVLSSSLSEEELNKTMSNPKYSQDILKIDGVYDRRSVINKETIIIVVGTNVVVELLDRPVAEWLRDQIDKQGGAFPYRRAIVISHEAWYAEANALCKNGVIAIGGPTANKLTKEFDEWSAPPSQHGEGKYSLSATKGLTGFFRHNDVRFPQVALWGPTGTATREAVQMYVANPAGLPEFLAMCWKRR
jgi:hypothetical protein